LDSPLCFGTLVLEGRAEELPMIDAEIIASSLSTLDRPPSRSSDPDPSDLDRLAASLHDLARCCGKPAADESGHHAAEAMAEHAQIVVDAVLVPCQQLEPSLLDAQRDIIIKPCT